MGVNTDDEEMVPGSTITDELELTEKACEFVHQLENDPDCDVGIQGEKPVDGPRILPISSLQRVPSHTSVVSNTELSKAQEEHTCGRSIVPFNTPLSLRPDPAIEEGNSELSSGALVFRVTNTSADDKYVLFEECSSPLQPAEIMEILELDSNDDWDAMYNTLLGEMSSSDADAFKLALPFNPDIDQTDEEGYTPLYKAASEGHLEDVDDLISRGAKPDKPSKGGLRPLHAAAQEGHRHIVDFLILQVADVSVECDLGQTPLHTAAANGYVDILESFIAEGPGLNQEDNTGWTPFHAAIQYGHLDVIEYLVTKGVKQISYWGISPLRGASLFGHLDVVKYFVSKGADVNEVTEKGVTRLYGAAARGHLKVMEYLIQQGSNVNKGNPRGWTPFYAAVQYGHLEAVKYLMTEVAEQNRYERWTPLYAAAYFGHLDIVKFFISKRIDVKEVTDKGMIPLHGAAARGHLKVMEYLIQQGSDVNKGNAKGWTPLNRAVRNGHLEAVKYLITKGAKQNRYAGKTSLYAAAICGHLDIVKFLVSEGANVNEENDEGKIPLHGAAARGHLKVMEYLIQKGSDTNKEDNSGWTPFNAAVKYGHLEAVRYLMTKGAKQNRYDGMTPFYAAAHFGHLQIVEFFISNGTDVNEEDYKGRIPLYGAAARGHLKVMDYLIQQGSNCNKSEAKGSTPFNTAVQYGHLEAVKYLMSKGAKQNRYAGMTPLYAAAQFGHLDIVDYFISEGADVNEKHDDGKIPLHGAAARGNVKVMEYLIQHGSDVNKGDPMGWTPLNAAVLFGHLEAVKYLITKGAKQKRYAGVTSLYTAAICGYLDIVEFLVSKGADVNGENDEGEIPLHGAAARGHLNVMEYLIQKGSDTNKEDNSGWTPFKTAVQYRHLDAVKYLMNQGAKQNRYYGMTALYAAAIFGHLHIVDYSVTKGADVNEKGDQGMTPLHGAASGGHIEVMHVLNECGKSPLHAGCFNGNMDIVKLLVHHNANINEQDHDGWTPLHAAAQEGHQDIVDYLTLNAPDIDARDIDDSTQLQAAANAGHQHTIEGISSCRGDPDEVETADQRSGGHQNLIRSVFVTLSLKVADMQSRTEQLAPRVDNVENGNDCTQADNSKRGVGELSLKSLPPRTHDVDKGGNGEHNPFIHAKLKYPDEGEQDPMLDQMEAIKCTGARKRGTITHDTDCSSPHAPQTWQHSRFDPPYLQTMEAGGHPSEEPESRCHSLIDEIKETRDYSSPMNAGNDLPIKETSVKFKSFPTHPPAVVHQKLHDGNPVYTQGTSSNPVRKIGTKLQTSVDRCPSILALAQTFLQMMLALVIILAGSPVLVAGSDITEQVTLQAGKPGVVQFHLPWPLNSIAKGDLYFTLRFESKSRPFSINGELDTEGFKSVSQLRRFTTSVTDLDTSSCVNLMIDMVDTLDEDGYVLTAVWHTFLNVRYETVKKKIDVLQIPPGPAKCFIIVSVNDNYPYEVHCRATTGSVTTTLSCYQNDRKIDVKGDIVDNGQVTSGIFWLPDNTHFSCCSQDVTLNVSETTCNDFEWPPDMHNREPTTQIVNTVPTFVTIKNIRPVNERLKTTPTIQIESHTESGACRQFMLPSLWHFTYLLVYILAFVTI